MAASPDLNRRRASRDTGSYDEQRASFEDSLGHRLTQPVIHRRPDYQTRNAGATSIPTARN
jgi:hypothetical protein